MPNYYQMLWRCKTTFNHSQQICHINHFAHNKPSMTGYNILAFIDNTRLSIWTLHFADAQQGSNKYHNKLNSIAHSDFTTHILGIMGNKSSIICCIGSMISFVQGQSMLMLIIKSETVSQHYMSVWMFFLHPLSFRVDNMLWMIRL